MSKSAYNVRKDERDPVVLYFFIVQDWDGGKAIPKDQTDFVNELETFADSLRLHFGRSKTAKDKAELENHFNRLLGTAITTFNGGDLQLSVGRNALAQHEKELLLQVNNDIKSTLTRKLPLAIGVALAVIWGLAVGIRYLLDTAFVRHHTEVIAASSGDPSRTRLFNSVQWFTELTPIHLAIYLTGVMLGLWTSAYVLNPVITFEHLRSPSTTQNTPLVRVAGISLLAIILALFFQSHAVGISVANISTAKMNDDALSALIVGICCGFSEPAMIDIIITFVRRFVTGLKSHR